MPVNTEHQEYINNKGRWGRMRTVADGQDAVHAAGERYLPKLSGESAADYDARLKRSSFFNATGRTIDGLVGMVMRADPETEVSSAVEPMLEDVTKSGVSFCTFAGQVLQEVLTVGRVGVLTDFPVLPYLAEAIPLPTEAQLEGANLGTPQADTVRMPTVAEVEAANLRPHMAMYKAENIVNWATEWINNRTALSLVVLLEYARVPMEDEFMARYLPRYRVLDLAFGAQGFPGRAYRVREYAAVNDNGKGITSGYDLVRPPIFPLLNGKPMTEIPFAFIGPESNEPHVQRPPLLDLADVNLSHYRSTSDRKHGAHLTALPQPWANKIAPQFGPDGVQVKQEWRIGGTDLWTFPNDSQVGMLEYTGQGLGTLKEEIEREEKQMAVLGARMLEQQQRQVESAEAAGIHRSGEQSALQSVAAIVSAGLTSALAVFDAWAGGNGDAVVALNKDMMPSSLSSLELTALVAAWQNGALSKEALFFNLQGGGIIPETVDFEEHEAQIAAAPPALATGLPTAPKPNAPPANDGSAA